MIISYLRLKNWKSFQFVEIKFDWRTFFLEIDPTDTSELFDALNFLRDLTKDEGLQAAITGQKGLLNSHAKHFPDVEIEVHLSEDLITPVWRYSIGIKRLKKEKCVLSYEKVWKNGEQILNRPNLEDEKNNLLLTQTHLEQAGANTEFKEIFVFFRSILCLCLSQYSEASTNIRDKSLLLFEEPKPSLNPKIMVELISSIYRLYKTKKQQIIISAHSTDLIFNKSIKNSKFLIVSPVTKGAKNKVCLSSEEIKILLDSGLTIVDAKRLNLIK